MTGDPFPYLTPDEQVAWRETDLWLGAEITRFQKMMAFTRKPIEYAYSKVPESLRESIANAILTVLTSVRDGTMGLVSSDAVREQLGYIPEGHLGHFQVGVRKLDAVALSLIGQSKNACMAEGAAAGLAGLPGIVVDIPALYGLLFRMIAQVAACYGYPGDSEVERDHMLKVLDVGHQSDPEPKRQGMDEIRAMQHMIGQDVTAAEAQRFTVTKGLQTMARHLGLVLTERKLAQSVAIVGGVVGAGINRQLASDIGDVAYHAYRRRYLTELAHLRQTGMLAGRGVSRPEPVVRPPAVSGNGRVTLDAGLMNALLKGVGEGMSYRDGAFHLERAGLELTLPHLPLETTSLHLTAPNGRGTLEVAGVEMRDEGITLEIKVQRIKGASDA